MTTLAQKIDEIKSIFRYRKIETAWQQKYEPNVPKVGEMAADFTLSDTTGEHTITLSNFIGKKPVALVFGSFTWPPYVEGTVSLTELYNEFQGQVQFIPVYVREAHPVDGWWMGFSVTRKLIEKRFSKAALDVYDPKTIEERRAVAGRCEQSLGYGVRTYVDEMDNKVCEAYTGWPTRLFLVGTDGRIIYRGGLGPWGFKPDELKQAIQGYLAN